MQARTIGLLAAKIGDHLGKAEGSESPVVTPQVEAETVGADEVDLSALSDDDVEGLLGDDPNLAQGESLEEARR
jgi:hypothetical protein